MFCPDGCWRPNASNSIIRSALRGNVFPTTTLDWRLVKTLKRDGRTLVRARAVSEPRLPGNCNCRAPRAEIGNWRQRQRKDAT